MDEERLESREMLAWIDTRLELISDLQHRLARQTTVLREQATRLRLGVSVAEVRAAMAHGGVTTATPVSALTDGTRIDDDA
jgi:hypothetical protein